MKDNSEMSSRIRYEQTRNAERGIRITKKKLNRQQTKSATLLAILAYAAFIAMIFAAAFGKDICNSIFK